MASTVGSLHSGLASLAVTSYQALAFRGSWQMPDGAPTCCLNHLSDLGPPMSSALLCVFHVSRYVNTRE